MSDSQVFAPARLPWLSTRLLGLAWIILSRDALCRLLFFSITSATPPRPNRFSFPGIVPTVSPPTPLFDGLLISVPPLNTGSCCINGPLSFAIGICSRHPPSSWSLYKYCRCKSPQTKKKKCFHDSGQPSQLYYLPFPPRCPSGTAHDRRLLTADPWTPSVFRSPDPRL